MKAEYPDEYFEHFMAMFNEQLTEDPLKNHLQFANSIEGIEYIEGLLKEFQIMKLNNDQNYFIELATEKGVNGFNENHIELLIRESNLMVE